MIPRNSHSDPSAALARSHVWRHRKDDVLEVLRHYYSVGCSLTEAIRQVCENRRCAPMGLEAVRMIGKALTGPALTSKRTSRAAFGHSGLTLKDRTARLGKLDKLVKAGAAEKSGAGRKGRR